VKLGFLTACLPDRPLPDIAAWAAGQGYEALEVAAWPALGSRPFTATHLAVEQFDRATADDVLELFDKHGLVISSLAYYDNNLAPDPEERRAVNEHVLACIDAAALLGCPTVGTFVGRHPGLPVTENVAQAAEVFKPIVDRAGEHDVKVIIENCVMEGWHPDGYPGNLAYSPELWEWMFSIGLYLNFDPSHLMWIGIDPVEAVRPYLDRIPHAQAKDVQLFARTRDRYGFFGKTIGCGWSTPCTRAASTGCCRSSTRTRSGAAPRTGSKSASRSPTARSARCSSADLGPSARWRAEMCAPTGVRAPTGP
jgi:sugar phosphate isomerase/epimerase